MSFAKAKLEMDEKDDCTALLDLKGKTVVDIGFAQADVEGGLTIDYREGNEIKRIVLGHNDLGTWVAWQGIKGKDNAEDILKIKVIKAVEGKDRCYSYQNFKKLTIIDDPMKRCFRFIGDSTKEILVLTVSEIKLLSDNVRQYFTCKSKEERITMMNANSGLRPTNDREFTQELLGVLYSWAQ